MSIQLTNGGIRKIFNDTDVESTIFQVLTIKYVHSGNGFNFFLRLSDGTHYSLCCIVGTQLSWVVLKLTPKSNIRVNRYECKNISENRKIVIILDLDILHIGRKDDVIIGNPKHYETSLQNDDLSNASSDDSQGPMEISIKVDQPGTSNDSQRSSSAGGSSGSASGVLPISSLRCNLKKWTIRARVIHKSNIIPYVTSGGGIRFYFDMMDESGEIRAAAFNQVCRRFYEKIELDKVYDITSSRLQMVDKRYKSLNNDYEIIFNGETQVTLCKKKTNIPHLKLQGVGTIIGMDNNLKMRGRTYYSTKATIVCLKKENCMYTACPTEQCNKKVDDNNGIFFCEKCKKGYNSFNWRYVLNVSIADGTGSIWVTLFQDEAESLLGCTADNLTAERDRDEDAFYRILNSVLYKEYLFKLMVKMESYEGRQNLKTTVQSLQPVKYDYNKGLVTELKCMGQSRCSN